MILFRILFEIIMHTILLLPTSFSLVQICALPVSTLECWPFLMRVQSLFQWGTEPVEFQRPGLLWMTAIQTSTNRPNSAWYQLPSCDFVRNRRGNSHNRVYPKIPSNVLIFLLVFAQGSI